MRNEDSESQYVKFHKEETRGRIASDANDRGNIREKLTLCVNPLKPIDHPKGILNIVTGKIGPDKVNVDNVVNIGQTQLVLYESG